MWNRSVYARDLTPGCALRLLPRDLPATLDQDCGQQVAVGHLTSPERPTAAVTWLTFTLQKRQNESLEETSGLMLFYLVSTFKEYRYGSKCREISIISGPPPSGHQPFLQHDLPYTSPFQQNSYSYCCLWWRYLHLLTQNVYNTR